MALLRMAAQHNNGHNTTSQQLVKPVLHDFLPMKPTDSPVVLAPKTAADVRLSEASPSSASVSAGGASSGGGARGPFSTTSEIGSGELSPSICLKIETLLFETTALFSFWLLEYLKGNVF